MPPNLSSSSLADIMPGSFETLPWIQFHLTLATPKAWRKRTSDVTPLALTDGFDWVHARQMQVTRRICEQILKTLEPLRATGVVRAACFQRKEPGVRWRVATDDSDRLRTVLAPTLDQLCSKGQGLSQWVETIYEPEAALFGGPVAIHPIHALMDIETRLWAQLVKLRNRQAMPFTDAALALAQTNALFAAGCGDRPEEVWDTWCRLAGFHGLVAPREATAHSRPNLQALADHAQSDRARPTLECLGQAQARTGAQLASLAIQGQLTQGLRGVLAALALFAWNRVGLTLADRRHVLTQAMQAWHPHVEPAPVLSPP